MSFTGQQYSDFMDYVNTEIAHYKREVLGQKSPAPATEEKSDNSDDSPEENPDANNTPEPSEDYGA